MKKQVKDYIDFVENQLIPDLNESYGDDEDDREESHMAETLGLGTHLLRELSEEIDRLKKKAKGAKK